MANRIKGITVEIGGDTTKLQTALKGVNGQIKSTQQQLKDVDKLLKLDPGNTELLAQKHKLLAEAVSETKEKLSTLKTAAEQANTALANGEISQEQYDALQREIIETEQALKNLETQANQSATAVQKIAASGEKLKTVGDNISSAGQKLLPVTAGVTALGTASVTTAANFESAMSQVQATMGITKDEKYVGDVICQKTYTDSEFNRHRNDGNLTQYLWENHHEPIIDRETFSKANAMLLQRAKEKGNGINTERYQNRYALSSKVICAECGGVFKRRKHYKPSGDYIAWCCNNHINHTKPCSMKYITDDAIKAAILTMKNKLIFAEDILLKPLLYSLQGFDDKDRLLNIEAIENQLEKVTEERQVLASLISSGLLEPGMASSENNKLNARERQLTAEKESIMNSVLGDRNKIRELEKLMKHLPQEMTADDFFSEFVDKILVLSREEIQLELKCGLKLKERLVAK